MKRLENELRCKLITPSLMERQLRKLIESWIYRRWIKKYDLLTEERHLELQKKIAALDLFSQPKISIIVPVYNTPLSLLQATINSVTSQIYRSWELCIADDGSTNRDIVDYLQTLRVNDSRVKIIFCDQRKGIVAATNASLQLATGDFVAFLDHDDLLSSDALAEVALAIATTPEVGYLYSDEDKIDQRGRRCDPFFKPDWNPDLLTSLNYCSHFSVMRRSLVTEVGGLHEGLEGAQDWDLILRITEKLNPKQIIHLPKVLYHWRLSKNSTARSVKAKPYLVKASQQVLEQCLQRRDRLIYGMEQVAEGGQWRVRYALPESAPMVSIIISSCNRLDLLQRCIESIQTRTNYPHYEILIADHHSDSSLLLQYLKGTKNLQVVHCSTYSMKSNHAVKQARGEILVLLNDTIEVIEAHWLKELVSHAVRSDIGAVGALLRDPNRRIQHAGIILGISDSMKIAGIAGHVGKFFKQQRYVGGNRMNVVQNFSAVTRACLAVRKKIYEEVGGLDERHLPISFNDVDFCLKLRAANYWNVWTPFASLLEHESVSRSTPEKINKEGVVMRARWGSLIDDDPAYNPNLTLAHKNWSLAWPPRKRQKKSS